MDEPLALPHRAFVDPVAKPPTHVMLAVAIGMHILLPLGWALGLLPPPLVALETFIERVHMSLMGGSPSTSFFHTSMLTAAAVLPIAALAAASYLSFHFSIVLSAVFGLIHARGVPMVPARMCCAFSRDTKLVGQT